MTQRPFVLIHSPLMRSLTWRPVAEQLREQGSTVFTPELGDQPDSELPLWQQHVESIDLAVSEAVLVGHSGAGALLPALGKKLNAASYLFVDAVLLFEPGSHLDLRAAEDPAFAQEFETYLQAGGSFPNWQDEQFQAVIPDGDLRRQFIADMHPRDLRFFTERIDVPTGWDAKPCGYLQLSAFYDRYATQAEQRTWPVIRRDMHHFAMLTQPQEIARLLLQLEEQLHV